MNHRIIIISAPSGSGKSTIINYLLEQNLPLQFAISATSRTSRGNEKNGVEYYFLTPQAFKKKIKDGEFIEYEEVYKDAFYGSLKSEVERIMSTGNHVIFDVDVVGGCQIKKNTVKKRYPYLLNLLPSKNYVNDCLPDALIRLKW